MKNQNDLIFIIVSLVVAFIILGVCYGTKREPQAPPAPEQVILTDPALPQGDVVMANALPGAGTSTGVDSGSGMGGGMGRPGGKKQLPTAAGGGAPVLSSGASGFGSGK